MLPDRINLPANTDFVSPNITSFAELSDEQIHQQLFASEIPMLITKHKTLVVINDGHRATPSFRILSELFAIPQQQISQVIIATGTHAPPDSATFTRLTLGIPCPVVVHNGLEKLDKYKYMGTTSRGTPVYLNPIVFEYDLILTINSVEPHYFAGYTGHFKSIIPGLAALATIEKNHSWALDPSSNPTITHGNPVFDDMWEMKAMLNLPIRSTFLVNIGTNVYSVNIGELESAFEAAKTMAQQIYVKQVTQKYDVVISVVDSPLNRSLYQAQKGLENTRQAVKSGGTIVLIAECAEGIGNQAFYETLCSYDSSEALMQVISQPTYHFGDHKAHKFASLSSSTDLFILSKLSKAETEHVFAKKITENGLEELLQTASSKQQSVLVVLDAGMMVVTT